MKRITITGAAGFIGANLCRHYLEQGWDVTAVCGATYAAEAWRLKELYNHDRFHYKNHFMTIRHHVERMFKESLPEVVINCVAFGSYSNQAREEKIYWANQTTVRHLMNAAQKSKTLKAFIQLGSSSEYGLNCTASKETSETIPNSHYAVSKLAATSLCQYYGKLREVPVAILRLGSVYGPYEDPRRFIMKACLTAHKEKKLIPLASTDITRDFIHIDDVCRAIDSAFDHGKPGEIYNVSRGYPQFLVDVLDDVSTAYGMPCIETNRLKQDADLIKPWDHFRPWCMNVDKIKDQFDWEPKIDMNTGIYMVKRWIEENPEVVKSMRSANG